MAEVTRRGEDWENEPKDMRMHVEPTSLYCIQHMPHCQPRQFCEQSEDPTQTPEEPRTEEMENLSRPGSPKMGSHFRYGNADI
jgi:hypothetical protein